MTLATYFKNPFANVTNIANLRSRGLAIHKVFDSHCRRVKKNGMPTLLPSRNKICCFIETKLLPAWSTSWAWWPTRARRSYKKLANNTAIDVKRCIDFNRAFNKKSKQRASTSGTSPPHHTAGGKQAPQQDRVHSVTLQDISSRARPQARVDSSHAEKSLVILSTCASSHVETHLQKYGAVENHSAKKHASGTILLARPRASGRRPIVGYKTECMCECQTIRIVPHHSLASTYRVMWIHTLRTIWSCTGSLHKATQGVHDRGQDPVFRYKTIHEVQCCRPNNKVKDKNRGKRKDEDRTRARARTKANMRMTTTTRAMQFIPNRVASNDFHQRLAFNILFNKTISTAIARTPSFSGFQALKFNLARKAIL